MITQSERSQRESDAMLLGTAAHTESIFMFTLCLITFTTRTSAEQSYESTTYLTTTKPTSPILPLEYLLWLNRLDGTSTGEYPQKATMFPRAVRLDAWRSDGSTLSAADRGFQFRQLFLNGRRRIRPSKVMTGSRHERWNCIWKDSNGKPWKSMWWAPRFQRLFGGPPIINGETSRIMITSFLQILISMNRFHLCNWPEMQGNLMKKWMLLTRHVDDRASAPHLLPRLETFSSVDLLEKYLQNFSNTYKSPEGGGNSYFAWVRTFHKTFTSTTDPRQPPSGSSSHATSTRKHGIQKWHSKGMSCACGSYKNEENKCHLCHLQSTYLLLSDGYNHDSEGAACIRYPRQT